MITITKRDNRVCLFCKRVDIETRCVSFIDKNGKIIVSVNGCLECFKKMKEELEGVVKGWES